MSGIIVVKGCLNDRDMALFDHENKTKKKVDWKRKDMGFYRISGTFKQKTPSWGMWSEHIIPELTPISDQLDIGSCVANAWCDAMEILDGLDGTDKVEQLSRLWVYWLARYLHGGTSTDDGTYIRAAAHQLTKVGVVLESDFPYQHANVFPKQVAADLYTMASNNRLNGFYRLTAMDRQRGDEIELSVRTNHPIVFGTIVTRAFTKYRGGGQVWTTPTSSVGRHAMIVVGVRYVDGQRQFLLRNSWGKDWGDAGHVWVTEDYILSSETRDLWVGTKCPPLI